MRRREEYQGRHARPHRRPRPFRKLKLIITLLVIAVALLYLALLLNRDWGRASNLSAIPEIRNIAGTILRHIA
jgi:hypothetical protein